MIDRFSEILGDAQTTRPWWFITAFALIVLAAIPGIFFLVGNVEASLENVLPPEIESVAAMNDARTQYSADMLHVVLYAQGAVTDIREVQSFAHELGVRIEQSPLVVGVNSELSGPRISHNYLIGVIDVQADTGTSAEQIARTLQDIEYAIRATENPGVEVMVTGFAAIDQATFSTIMSDFLRITGLSMFLIIAVVFSLFRKVRSTAVPLIAVMVALIVTMGITGYLQITITVVTMVAAAMILGLGIDFGIHTIHSYTEYKKTLTTKKALKKTVNELFRAQLGASMTTSAGFLALGLGVLPAMADLGLVLALGVVMTFIASTMLLPPILLLTEKSQ